MFLCYCVSFGPCGDWTPPPHTHKYMLCVYPGWCTQGHIVDVLEILVLFYEHVGPEFPMGFPDGVTTGILTKFASPGKSKRSFQMTKLQKDRLLNYLLALVLIIEKFSFSYMALARDLKVTGTKYVSVCSCHVHNMHVCIHS